MSNNSITVIGRIIKELKIPVTLQSVVDELEKHPAFPSLLSISDVLNNWNIPNEAYTFSFDELLVSGAPIPFIACTKKGEFLLVTKIDESGVVVSNEHWTNRRLGVTEFRQLYQDVVLVFEKSNSSGEPNYRDKRRREVINKLRNPSLALGIAVIYATFLAFCLASGSTFTISLGLLIVFKTAGLGISILLLMQSADSNNPLLQKLCGTDKNKNCHAILSSKAAKISDELSWSEVGFFYFAGSLLVVLICGQHIRLIQFLAILNILGLPYTFYSIYYQGRIARQWCLFCLSIQGLLWLEFFAFLPYFSNKIVIPSVQESGLFLISMLVPLLSWIFVKPLLLQSALVKPLKQQLRVLKYNTEVFDNMLVKEIQYRLIGDEDSILIGSTSAKNTVTVVSNPFCNACSKTHKLLDELAEYSEDVRLQFLFVARSYNKARDNKVVRHFMSLKTSPLLKQAINDWYAQENKDYELWEKKYPYEETASTLKAIETQLDWCRMVGIEATPTVFINGRKLPKVYQPQDLKYILK